MKQIKILIVDDHEIIHNGLEDILRSQEQYRIVGHAYNGKEGIEKARDLKPDIIFMDISMPVLSGIDAAKSIIDLNPSIKIIALTQHMEDEYVYQVLKAGGMGYLLKNSKKEDFTRAISQVMENKRFLSYELSDKLLEKIIIREDSINSVKKVHLTRREIEIIRKISEDKNNQEIADDFCISLRTVETHRRNIMQKLNAKSIISVLKYATLHNLIDL